MFRSLAIAKNHVNKLALLSVSGRSQRCTAIKNHNRLLVNEESFLSARSNSSKTTFKYQKSVPPTARITSAELHNATGMVNVTLSNEETRQYPFVWLYDNCPCEVCRNKSAGMRATSVSTLHVDIEPQHVQTTEEGLEVIWDNGHPSLYAEKWLVSHTFPASVSDEVLPWTQVVKHWGREMQQTVPTFSYNDLIEDNQVLYQWLETMKIHGISLIPDAGPDIDNLERLAMRVGYPVPSNYGPIFEVSHFMEPSDEPVEAISLPLHTDQAFEQVPEIVMLHMVKQAEGGGGAHKFVDGFNAASQLREQDPEAFRILTTTNVLSNYNIDLPEPSFYQSVRPIISLDEDNQISTIRFSNHTRAAELPLSADKVKPFYLALKTFHNLLSHPNNVIHRKPLAGEIVCLNNLRCLHGRTSYMVEPGKTNSRLVKGCFLSWQDVESRQRVIAGMRDKLKAGMKV